MNFSSCKWVLIKDISLDNVSVRIVGKLKEYDLSLQWAILEHQKQCIKVDTRYLGDFKHIIGNFYSVLGEIQRHEDSQDLALNARLIRNVNGLDMTLYGRILEKRLEFLDKLSKNQQVCN